MDGSTFETLMSGFESLFVALAVSIGGIWTVFKFKALDEKHKAEAELKMMELECLRAEKAVWQDDLNLRKTEAEIRELEPEIERLEQQAREQAVIEISIDTSQISMPRDTSRYVSTVVEIRNKGTRNTRLEFPEDRRPFSVSPVQIKEDGEWEFMGADRYSTPVATSLHEESPSSVVRAEGLERIPFVFRVASVGLYLLIFSVPVPQKEKEIAKKLGFKYGANWVGKNISL